MFDLIQIPFFLSFISVAKISVWIDNRIFFIFFFSPRRYPYFALLLDGSQQ
jgi:hypothetical protein